MANEVKLPRLGQGMEAGTIVKWLKSEGETVEKGEPLYELDTEKVTQEVEADFSGVLLKIAIEEGEVPVGQTIAVIGDQGETVEVGGDDGAPQSAEKPARAPKRDAERELGRAASIEEQVTEVKAPIREDGRVNAGSSSEGSAGRGLRGASSPRTSSGPRRPLRLRRPRSRRPGLAQRPRSSSSRPPAARSRAG